VLDNVPPDAGLLKRAIFSTLNVGLAGTGNQTLATCVASSGTIRSAIHYAIENPAIDLSHFARIVDIVSLCTLPRDGAG
jgi:hypothetical protein